MTEAVIVDAVRTPIGKRNGDLAGVHPVDLSALVLRAVAERNGLDPAMVEDVIWGCVSQVGEQSMNIGRHAVLAADWPETVPATTVDRQCGSSQQAATFAAAGVLAGHYDIVVAGGVESMSRVPMFSSVENGTGEPGSSALLTGRYGDRLVPQGIGAEMIAEKWALSRTRLDEIAIRSHERAAAAIDSGAFDTQLVGVERAGGDIVTTDQGVRRDTSLAALAKLPAPFREDGRVTAGNASQISDGAAALLIMSDRKAEQLGLRPLARFVASTVVGVDPVTMLTGPIPATHKVLGRAGLSVADIGAFEVNEAFASVIGAWEDEIGADPAKLNVHGGAIALGHPLGCSGARVMATLVHHLRQAGIRYGLQAICEGGGMANATILESLS
jgi:acetyl-CoA acyltransferase